MILYNVYIPDRANCLSELDTVFMLSGVQRNQYDSENDRDGLISQLSHHFMEN